jgi:hypothetical protein
MFIAPEYSLAMALKKADDGAKTLHNLSGRKEWQVLFSIRRLNANPTL